MRAGEPAFLEAAKVIDKRVAEEAVPPRDDPTMSYMALQQVFASPMGPAARFYSHLMLILLLTVELSYVLVSEYFGHASVYMARLIARTKILSAKAADQLRRETAALFGRDDDADDPPGTPAFRAVPRFVAAHRESRSLEMWSCPCGTARAGACVSAWCAYWLSVTGWPAMLAHIARGDGAGVVWTLLAIFGFGGVLLGIREALRHDDAFNGDSFLWSVAVIALGIFAVRNGWYLDDTMLDWHLSHAFWLGWTASNAVNIWLQLRGMRRREARLMGEPAKSHFFFRSRRRLRQTREWSEEIEARVLDALPARPAPRPISPAVVERSEPLPQIVYVKEGDAFVPVRLPLPAAPAIEHQP